MKSWSGNRLLYRRGRSTDAAAGRMKSWRGNRFLYRGRGRSADAAAGAERGAQEAVEGMAAHVLPARFRLRLRFWIF